MNPERGAGTAHAGAVLAAADRLVAIAADVLSRPARLRHRAREQVVAANEAEVVRRLETTPVASLRTTAGRGARLGALDRAGVRTVADVIDAGPAGLASVPGVGPATADQVTDAARAALSAVRGEVRFQFDLDQRNGTQSEVLATLAALRSAEVAATGLRGDLTGLTDRLVPLADAARGAESWFWSWFSWPSTKRTRVAAVDELAELLAEPSTQALGAEAERRLADSDPATMSTAALWEGYRRDAAAVNAVLSTVDAGGVDDDAAHGFVPDALGQPVADTELDLSRLRPTTTLRGYQAFGARYALHQGRVILGDEMGLGKTLQALASIGHLAARGSERFLVVCPASVQINWLNEIERHTVLDAYNLHGRSREKAGREWIRRGGIAVTTFGTLARLSDDVRTAPTAVLVVDEAHHVKNPEAARSKAVGSVVGRSERTLFLTGTPMENRVEEFRVLVGYLNPRLASRIDARAALGGARAFRRAVSEVYLRRNQDDVLTELPERIETESWVHPSKSDLAAYRDAVESGNLMAMRRAAWAAERSAKLERLEEIVAEAEQDGLKVLVFSGFLGVLDLVGREVPGVVGRIDGSVGPQARQQVVEDFSARPEHAVLVSQVEAGGVGINIQAASVVVLAEPQWKPSTEEQAIARAHRMGQTRPVQVHRLLAKDTVDERVREIQEGKRLLFDAYARRSDAKDADRAAVDVGEHRPAELDNAAVSDERRVVLAERHRLGLR